MTEVKVQVSGEEYTILKCDDSFRLSVRVSSEFPDFVLIRQSTVDIIALVQAKMEKENVRRFLITGTPGVGKTVSVIVWLYLALKGELKMSFKHIIADLKAGCIFLSQTATDTWVEEWCHRDILKTRRFHDTNAVLYLYDATYHKLPLFLPYRSVVFSSPNLLHFREFIKIDIVLRMIYYTPMWQWDEIEALHQASTALQTRAPLVDVQRLFEVWGGLPRQIFAPFQIGCDALTDAIKNCNAVACIQLLEKGSFLSYGERDAEVVRSTLMQFNVKDDKTYEHAMVNFGSPFIRDGLVEASGKSFTNYYREFMDAHGSSDYATKVRRNLYERLVLDKLRDLPANMDVLHFTMEAGKANTAVGRMPLPALGLPAKEYSALGDINDMGRVWIPHQSNFKSFDVLLALPPPVVSLWMQITVGKTHSLHVEGVHDCIQRCMTLQVGSAIAFCLPPDIFGWWHQQNTVQNFATQTGKKAEIHQYLNVLKQIVLCIPGDAVEEEKVKTMMNLV